MKFFIFEAVHGYRYLKGYLRAESEEQAIKMIENEGWDDLLDEGYINEYVEGYEIIDICEDKYR